MCRIQWLQQSVTLPHKAQVLGFSVVSVPSVSQRLRDHAERLSELWERFQTSLSPMLYLE